MPRRRKFLCVLECYCPRGDPVTERIELGNKIEGRVLVKEKRRGGEGGGMQNGHISPFYLSRL